MRIVFLDTKTIGTVHNMHLLEKFGDVTYYETTYPEETLERVKDAEVIITNKVIIDRQVIENSNNLKLICVAATGINNIDVTAAHERDIEVKNVGDYSSNSVAQGTFWLLLNLVNRIQYYDEYVKHGAYSKNDIFTHLRDPFWELSDKRFDIIGLGNIGKKVAKIASAFGCEIVYYSTSGRNNAQTYQQMGLEELLRTSDVVSIHAPLNENTTNLINYERMLQMKKSAILINVGRGGIINERDLALAIDENVIAGAGIDVFGKEPIDRENPLLKVKNAERLFLTPHVTWASVEARTLLIEKVAQNIGEFLKNRNN